MRKLLIISGENMIKSATARLLSDSEKLALALLLRDAANNPALQDTMRRNAVDANADSPAFLAGKPGEYKTVPVTTTNVEGIGAATVTYGTMSFQVTSNSAKAEKRAVFGDHMSGFAVINE